MDIYGEAFAVATRYILKKTPEIFTTVTPVLTKIMEKKEYVDGGYRLSEAVQAYMMQNIATITGTAADILDVSTQKNLECAQLDWKHIYSGFSVTQDDIVKTGSSKHAIASLMAKKAENSIASTKEFIAAQLFGSAVNNPKDLNGFGDMFAASGTAYAGLVDTNLGNDSAGDPIWLPKIDSSSTYVDYETISPMITKLKTKCSFDGRGTILDYMVSDATTFSAFKVKQQAQQRFVAAKDLQAGFDGLIVDGVTWYADDHVQNASSTARTLYLIATDSIKLLYKFGFGGEKSPLDVDQLRIPNQPILSNQKLHAGNFFMVNRRVNGVFKALNPSASRS